MALLHVPPSLRDWHHAPPLTALQHKVEYTAGEARVEWQVVRQLGEVVRLVTSNIELSTHVEVRQLSGGQTGDVFEVIHLEPGTTPPSTYVDGVDVEPLVYRGGSEDPPGPGPEVPCQEKVALDVGHGQVVAALPGRPPLAHEDQQSHLVHHVGGEVELGLEIHTDILRRLVGEEGGVPRHPAGEGGLQEGDLLLTQRAPPAVRTETDEAPGLTLTNAGATVETRRDTAGQSLTQRPGVSWRAGAQPGGSSGIL